MTLVNEIAAITLGVLSAEALKTLTKYCWARRPRVTATRWKTDSAVTRLMIGALAERRSRPRHAAMTRPLTRDLTRDNRGS